LGFPYPRCPRCKGKETIETDDGDQDNLARSPTLDDKAETSTRTHNDGVDLIDETMEIEGACVDHPDDVYNQEHDVQTPRSGSAPKNINKLW